MTPIVSIMIPTYNRAVYLRECLDSVLSQTLHAPVEVVVIDNASTDETPRMMEDYTARYPVIRSFRNDRNLGYAGNQARCVEYADGRYIAILCDDDVYLPGAVAGIVEVVQRRNYAFVALNYCGFTHSASNPRTRPVGPLEDFEFSRAYDVMKHPSVGHYSGFVFNAALAKQGLAIIMERHELSDFEAFRGILGELSVRALIPAVLPSFYVGRPLVGARQPLIVDYDSLEHLCLNYYRWALELHEEGVLSDADLAHRRNEVLGRLPKALYRNAGYFDGGQRRQLREQLDAWFKDDPAYVSRIVPILRRLESGGMRWALRLICCGYRTVKPLWWKIRR